MLDLKILPNDPGCYLFKDKKDTVIYVGKAKNLKKRVKSYFQKEDFDIKTQSMIKNINSFDFVATDSEVEALILEDTLIKKHQPKYNIRLKDAKSHSYILLTNEESLNVKIDAMHKTINITTIKLINLNLFSLVRKSNRKNIKKPIFNPKNAPLV